MKQRIFFVIFISVLLFGGLLYLSRNKNTIISKSSTNQQDGKSITVDLVVVPQAPTDKVLVESATFTKDSYLVVREMEGNKLSQVVEISAPLKPGTFKNIPIPLGGADIKGKELIVMVYDDQSNDGIFNDFDLPTIDENGRLIARYVKTGQPLPESISEEDASGGMQHSMAGMASMEKVKYTDKGFVPDKIKVPVGSLVEFKNESSKDMWVASAPHPSHVKLPTFDQFKSYKKGRVYRYVFDKKGTWEYHDHINPGAGGVVTVN